MGDSCSCLSVCEEECYESQSSLTIANKGNIRAKVLCIAFSQNDKNKYIKSTIRSTSVGSLYRSGQL